MFRFNSPWAVIGGSVVIIAVLIILLACLPGPRSGAAGKPPLIVYCGAGIRLPVEAAAKGYEKNFGVPFTFQYGPSQTLLMQAELSHKGDLYLPGDDNYVEIAREKGLIDQSTPIARMMPALAVRKGNPKRIKSLNDLLRPGVRLAQTPPEMAAAGRLVQQALKKAGRWEEVKAHTTIFRETVNAVADDIRVGAADAGFVWDVLVKQYPDLELVAVSQLAGTHALVTAGTLKSSSQPTTARHFIRYLAAEDKGLRVFKEYGFEPVTGRPRPEGP
jgi:molybdate transport system substrate-binding protein